MTFILDSVPINSPGLLSIRIFEMVSNLYHCLAKLRTLTRSVISISEEKRREGEERTVVRRERRGGERTGEKLL
jgi:hypothetical protein